MTPPATSLVLSDPPAAPPIRQDRYAAMLELRDTQKPGTWGRIATYPAANTNRNAVLNLRKGSPDAKVPEGRWEFRGGRIPDGEARPEGHTHGVWACYLGP